VDLIVVGACIEKSMEQTSPVALVVGKEKSVLSETAPRKKAANYAIIVPHFLAIHFCKVINVCGSITHFSALGCLEIWSIMLRLVGKRNLFDDVTPCF